MASTALTEFRQVLDLPVVYGRNNHRVAPQSALRLNCQNFADWSVEQLLMTSQQLLEIQTCVSDKRERLRGSTAAWDVGKVPGMQRAAERRKDTADMVSVLPCDLEGTQDNLDLDGSRIAGKEPSYPANNHIYTALHTQKVSGKFIVLRCSL